MRIHNKKELVLANDERESNQRFRDCKRNRGELRFMRLFRVNDSSCDEFATEEFVAPFGGAKHERYGGIDSIGEVATGPI